MTWWSRLVESGSRKALQPGSGLPYYTELERNRLGKIRRDFSDLENSPKINRLRTEYESELLSLPRRPAEDEPLLASLIVPPSGFFTVTLPDSTPCLLTFSTPLGRVKYARIRAGSVQLQYLPSSPKKFVQLLGKLKSYGNIQSFVLDVCPHCMTFPRLNTNSMLAPADVLQIWAIHKSGELARESLYFASANEAAGRGNLQEAKETTVEAIQHVTNGLGAPSSPAGQDRSLLREKKVFGKRRPSRISARETIPPGASCSGRIRKDPILTEGREAAV